MSDIPIIDSYTRAQAIADGILIDVSELASECGFKFPVAITNTVYQECINAKTEPTQDETGRLWDMLNMLRLVIKRVISGDQVIFEVIKYHNGQNSTIQLKALLSPGDQAEPVITVMYPNED